MGRRCYFKVGNDKGWSSKCCYFNFRKKQPDWFAELYSVLHPLMTKRNQLFQRWPESQLPED